MTENECYHVEIDAKTGICANCRKLICGFVPPAKLTQSNFSGVAQRYRENWSVERINADKLTRKNARADAVRTGASEHIAPCAWHDETLFDTATGACLACVADKTARRLPPMLAYRESYGDKFPKPCERHGGAALAYTSNGLCVECFDAYGRPRADPQDNPRAAARRAGEKTYRDVCAVHSEANFSVLRGKCLQCYNTAGIARPNTKGTDDA